MYIFITTTKNYPNFFSTPFWSAHYLIFTLNGHESNDQLFCPALLE